MLKFLAHGSEFHGEGTSEAEHYLSEPYIAIPLFFVSLIFIYAVSSKLIKTSVANTILLMVGYQFFVGVLAYRWVPEVSMTAISLGMGMCLFFVFTSLKK